MEELRTIAIKDIRPNPYQPRIHFEEEALQELAASIQQNGLIQPIIVRKSAVVGYELLAGERRLRASQLAGLETIPAVVKELTDKDLLYQSIIENLQRSDLNPIEEANSYQNLIEKGLTHEEIAQIMGKSRPYISNILRLLTLSTPLKIALENGKLSQGHARLLIGLPEQKQEEWLHHILSTGISVRQLETELTKNTEKNTTKRTKNIFIEEEETKLRKYFGTKVQIHQKKSGAGQITIHFDDPTSFERIINNLK